MHITVACVLLDYVSGLDSLQMLVDLTVYNSAKGTYSRLQYVPGHIAPISSHDFGRKQKAWYRMKHHDQIPTVRKTSTKLPNSSKKS